MTRLLTKAYKPLLFIIIVVFGLSYYFYDKVIDAYIEDQLSQSVDQSILHDGNMHVIFGGTGPLSTDLNRVGSCIAILAGGETFLFDVGAGATRVLANTPVPLQSVKSVFFTHFHSDHFSDFGELMVATRIIGRTEPLEVYGPEGVDSVVKGFSKAFAVDHEFREAQHGNLLDKNATKSRVHQLTIENHTDKVVVVDRNGILISAFLVDHSPVTPAFGYRIEYKGKVVVISGDTKKLEQLSVHAQGADVLIHEAMDKELAKKIIKVGKETGYERLATLVDDALVNHSSEIDAAEIATKAKVKTLYLTHVSPPMDNFLLRRNFINSAKEHFDGEVILAEDGMHFTLEL